MKLKLYVHNEGFKVKPEGKKIGFISTDIINHEVEVTVQELAKQVGELGKTTVLALMNGKRNKENMVEQQVIMIDFDNTKLVKVNGKNEKFVTEGSEYTSIQDVLNNEFVKNNASFIYKTLSYKENWEKFRVVFVLDRKLTNLDEVYNVYEYLFTIFPNADVACKDSSRIFFGGTETIEINFENNLETESIPFVLKKVETKKVKVDKQVVKKAKEVEKKVEKTFAQGSLPVHFLIKQGKKEEVAKKLSVYKGNFNSELQAKQYLKSLDMSVLLGIEYKKSFLDIFETESKPSASIFETQAGTSIYMNHATNFKGDIVHVVGKLLKVKYDVALNYLFDVCEIKIIETDDIKLIRKEIEMFNHELLSEDFKELYPHASFYLNRYKTDVVSILTIFKENVCEDENGVARILNWASVRTLSKQLCDSERQASKVTRILNLLTYLKVINKLQDNEIPKFVLSKLKQTQNLNKRKMRSNVFEVNLLDNEFLQSLNEQCKEMRQNGFTMRGFSKEYVERTHGVETAREVFVQDKKKISKKSNKMVMDIHKVVNEMIQEQGYAIEKDVMTKIQKKYKSKGFTEIKYKQAVSEMLDLYCLERKRLTKDLKEKFNVNNLPVNSSPTVLFPAY